MIDISIIIPVYNVGMLIERCLDSIFGQQTKYSYEVLLIDDGSTDNSVELIRQRKEQNIMLLQQSNSGPAKARKWYNKQKRIHTLTCKPACAPICLPSSLPADRSAGVPVGTQTGEPADRLFANGQAQI